MPETEPTSGVPRAVYKMSKAEPSAEPISLCDIPRTQVESVLGLKLRENRGLWHVDDDEKHDLPNYLGKFLP